MNDTTPLLDELILNELASLLEESLKKIRHCLGQLSDDQVWQRPSPSLNSIGNLLLHISGNLRQWAVNGVRQLPDDRARDAEFQATGRSTRAQLLTLTEEAVQEATRTFRTLDAETLKHPRTIQGFDVSILGALFHTVTHFAGHTHQIIQLTRLHLGDAYMFQWTPDSSRDSVPL